MKKALIIYAHPRSQSFSNALLQRVNQTLIATGYDVTIRDLYALNFNPVLSAAEAIHVQDGNFTRDNADFPADVKIEQDLIEASDLLIYIFPIWWNGMPAIMKGYVDRVFQHGFAYSFESDEPKKRFKNKKALFFTPTGQPQNADGSDTDLDRDIKTVTSSWMFNGNGTQVIDHVFYGRVPYLSEQELSAYLTDAQQRIEALS